MSAPARLLVLLVRTACVAAALAATAIAARADDAARLVDAMKAARASEGFELRFTATRVPGPAGGEPAEPARIAVIGQLGGPVEHLLARAIAPAALRDDEVLVEQAEGVLHARARAAAHPEAAADVDPGARLFGTALAAWDLMTPWWQWPDQQVLGSDEVDGHACIELRSRQHASDDAAVAEVRSCVDAREGLAWRVRLFDRRHRLVRTIVVERAMRTQAGTSTAKRALVTRADGGATRIEVYGGDEHHLVGPDTFVLATRAGR